MTKFMANWTVESEIALPDGVPSIRYTHPSGTYTVFLRPGEKETPPTVELLLQIIFDAPTIKEADDIGERHAKEFLDYLSFVSNMHTRLGRVQHVFNWEPSPSPGAMRDAIYFHNSHPGHGPYEALDTSLLDTLAILQKSPVSARLRRALKWFANGLAARFPDDQFAFFWFVIEIIAQIIKNVTPVPDKCPRCQSPLYCPTCNASHMHRPYPKQAVEQVFHRFVRDGRDDFYSRATRARNMLLHGEEISNIEAELRMEFSKLVNAMGHLAWAALFDQFVPAMQGTKPAFLTKNMYVHMNLAFSADMQFGFTPDFDDPDPAKFPKVNISIDFGPRAPDSTSETDEQSGIA